MKILAESRKTIAVISSVLILAAAALFAGLVLTHSKLYSVQSGSMSPFIEKGDLVVVGQRSEDGIRVGDVITYANPQNIKETITHRVVATPTSENEYKFITKGDANPLPDKPIAYEYIVGEEALSVPNAGYVLDFARQPVGLLALIYIPALFLLASEARRLLEYYRSIQPYYASEAIRKMLEERRDLARKHLSSTKVMAFTVFFVSLLATQFY